MLVAATGWGLSNYRHGVGLRERARFVVPVDEPMFARLEIAPPDEVAAGLPPTNGFVEIDTAGIIIRLPGDCTSARIADVVSALSAGR